MASSKNKRTKKTTRIIKLLSCRFGVKKKQAPATRKQWNQGGTKVNMSASSSDLDNLPSELLKKQAPTTSEQQKKGGMKADMSAGSSNLVGLHGDLLRQVACFLGRDDLGSLALTSPTIYQHLSIGSVHHHQGRNLDNNDRFVNFNDRFGYGWGYAAKLQGVVAGATFANRPIHSMQVSFRWRDQGWGNQKGMARVVAVNADNTSHCQVSCTHSAGIAPHAEAEQKSMCFMPVPGMEYFLQILVGGGGGHSLHLKNIQLHYIIFDDEEHSVTRTHQQLLGGGTTVALDFPLLLRQCQAVLAELHGRAQMGSQEEITELDAILKRMGREKTPASLELLQEVLLAESKYQEQVQATTWTMGIGSSEPMPTIANNRRPGLRLGW